MPEKEDVYENTFRDICTLYEKTLGLGEDARRRQTIDNFWHISRHILELEKRGESVSGRQLVVRLSRDLTEKYGRGFKERTVEYIRGFAREYRLKDLDTPLSWSHYKALMAMTDRARRSELEALAIAQTIGAKRLERLVGQLSRSDETAPAEEETRLDRAALLQLLAPRSARAGIYRVVADPGAPGRAMLDLGFRVELKGVCPAALEKRAPQGTARLYVERVGRQWQEVRIQSGERYCYAGTLVSVVDGDTVNVRLDLGFDVYKQERLRLKCVDAPEQDLPEGKKARDFIVRRLKPGDPVTVLTYGDDLHGRYVADLFFGGEKKIYLNLECIAAKVARFVDSRG